MKYYIFILISCVIVLSACKKVITSKALPQIEGTAVTSLTASQIAWVNQMALQKADSVRIVDSLSKVTGNVDTNSLFNKKNMMIAIVEVNDHYFPNVNCYVDKQGKQIFDLAFPFSANLNINPSTGKAYVSYNTEHQAMLRLGIFKQVQKAGVKIGLSLLGNHDDAGLSNFKNLADATAFAQIVAFEVRTKGFDAVLADDEYSNYVSDAAGNSYVMVMSEIKRLLPEIYLCYYQYGGGSGSFNGKQMGDICDANFQAFYPGPANTGSLNFPASKCFPATSETDGAFGDPLGVAKQAVKDGNGGIMFYNVCGRASSPDFYAPYLMGLKGLTLNVAPGCLNPNEFSGVNGK